MRKFLYGLAATLLTCTTYCLPAAAAVMADGSQSESVTAQIFAVDFYSLDNGIPVITRKRHDNDLFSIQLVVNLGLKDFPCEDRHLPHVVEHLLFEGTQSLSAKEQRAKIFDRGGYWEAFTVDEYTYYTMHIHKNFSGVAIDTLHQMIQQPALSERGTINSIRAVNTELGTASGGLQNWISDTLSIAEQGKNRLYPGTNLACEKRHNPNHLTLDQAVQAFRENYVPANFTLLVVGQFQNEEIRELLNNSFGRLPLKEPPPKETVNENPIDYSPIEETEKYGDPTAYFQMFVRADGKAEPTWATWELLAMYLTERLFAEIRTQRGIGYTPKVIYDAGPALGYLRMDVRTTSEWVDQVEAISLAVYQDLKTKGISPADIERLRNRLIYAFEATERDNKNLLQIYRHYTDWIKTHGHMKNLIHDIQALNETSVSRLVEQLPEQPLRAMLRPNSFMEATFKVLGIVLLAAFIAIPLHRRIKQRRQ